MRTWAKWVEENVDPKRTSLFFSSMFPQHLRYYGIVSFVLTIWVFFRIKKVARTELKFNLLNH